MNKSRSFSCWCHVSGYFGAQVQQRGSYRAGGRDAGEEGTVGSSRGGRDAGEAGTVGSPSLKKYEKVVFQNSTTTFFCSHNNYGQHIQGSRGLPGLFGYLGICVCWSELARHCRTEESMKVER